MRTVPGALWGSDAGPSLNVCVRVCGQQCEGTPEAVKNGPPFNTTEEDVKKLYGSCARPLALRNMVPGDGGVGGAHTRGPRL